LLIKFVFAFLLSLAEGVLKELLSPALLHRLLLKDILQQIFVALDEALRVDLPVLDLLFTVALDPLEQRLQTLLVLLPQLLHFAQERVLQVLVHHVRLEHLLLLDHGAHRVRPVVVLH